MVCGLLPAVASLAEKHRLEDTWVSVLVVQGLSFSEA